MLGQAQEGRPFLMNVQTNETTRARMNKYRSTLAENGFDSAHTQQCVDQTLVWRNIFVADSDAKARKLALPAFEEMIAFRHAMRERIYREQGVRMNEEAKNPARAQADHAVICGTPDTVAKSIAEIDDIGVGGLLLQFRLGSMYYANTARSIELFMREVAPQFH